MAQDLSDSTLNVHVVESRALLFGNDHPVQQIKVVIDGYRYELEADSPGGVLALGDYKARLQEQSGNGYDIRRTYIFLLPDGKTRNFHLSAILK